MHIYNMIVLPALLVSFAAAQGTTYLYDCYGCDCNAYDDATFTDNGGTNGECLNFGGESSASSSVGLSGGSSFHCTMWETENCTGRSQNVGIRTGQTWGCTNAQNSAWWSSLQCWTR